MYFFREGKGWSQLPAALDSAPLRLAMDVLNRISAIDADYERYRARAAWLHEQASLEFEREEAEAKLAEGLRALADAEAAKADAEARARDAKAAAADAEAAKADAEARTRDAKAAAADAEAAKADAEARTRNAEAAAARDRAEKEAVLLENARLRALLEGRGSP